MASPESTSESKRKQLAEWLATADRAIAFTGAGISTESGIPDFRSPGGVWSKTQPVYYDDFLANSQARYEYWRQKAAAHQAFASAVPNQGHQLIASWQQQGRLQGVITQNIDGLHQDASSRRVLELHGTAREVECQECRHRFEAGAMVARFLADDQPPPCPDCGAVTKHATVSFGQSLPAEVLDEAMRLSRRADLFLAIGSSLVVQPAASLPALAKQSGARLVVLNRDPTPLDSSADLVLNSPIGETLAAVDRAMRDESAT